MENAQKLSRKEKRRQRVLDYIINPTDIRYQGPLSYRYLRIIAWIAFAFTQILALAAISRNFLKWETLSPIGESIIGMIGDLSTPLFVVASFGLILSGKKTHKEFLILYGASFIGLGLVLSILYLRYVDGLLNKFNADVALDYVTNLLVNKVGVNVFADLFMLSSFCYFVEYHPKKFFKGKKIYLFRCLSILPILYIVSSYILKTMVGFAVFELPFYFYPFLATKSPFVFLIFIVIAIWIKNREKLFLSIGASRAQYKEYLKTNKNSLAFSIRLSFTILVFVSIEFILYLVLGILLIAIKSITAEETMLIVSKLGIGQTMPLVLAIPFIMLYSYTRYHKNNLIDLFIPVIGIALSSIVYIEWIYQYLIRFVN